MKQFNNLLWYAVIAATAFTSCKKDDDADLKSNASNMAYIVNYGGYSGSKAEISIYDIEKQSITNNAYKTANSIDFTSNIQSMAIYNGLAYFMSNNGDKIDIVDAKTLVQSINPISTNIIKPRYFTAINSTAYISCWGAVASGEWSTIPNSYIAKMDLNTKTVTKIPLAGGPEGVIIVNNKLYAGLCTSNKVAVIDLTSQAISYINVSAIPQHFVVDVNGNLWVSLVSKYSNPYPANALGLAVINTQSNAVIEKINFAEMGADGYINISADKKTIYAMGSEVWPGVNSTIYSINVITKTLSSNALITGTSFYGFDINPDNDNLYVLISPNATSNGTLKIYDKSGTLLDEETTGISPVHAVFYNSLK